MLKVAILGGSGYTGSELLRLLLNHPDAEVTAVTSERYSGLSISDTFLNFRNTALKFESLNLKALIEKADLFFLCLPHKTSQNTVAFLHNAGKRVIDLSADYRLKSAKVYKEWYNIPHLFSPLLKKTVYGLPEINRKKIRNASIIANPGCYPVSAILGLAPVMGESFIDTNSIIIDSKSGTSGAGRSPAQPFMFCEVNESVKAYAVTVHRHTPEIEQELSYLSKKKIKVIFTPHLVPMDRGMLSTIYVRLQKKTGLLNVQKLYKEFYSSEPFVRILKDGTYPATKAVKGSNYCDISIFLDERSGKGKTLIIVSAIDNLLKGASGSAVQNMNIMYGFDETAGLMVSPPSP
ncbi:MAG TPA: N-acetyl-gamma-glutamyl-phosphate reductase [Nitrospirae bacterium]|nr:N-acetyl-gamma-glutamyl-phosphate reductase [bacterium BMS3Abin06]HDH11479.1 N-acetyl-gamma-glutamyl-phosphate reductase [Nitrospirota bacterium]HDZ01367.1 N-acetyl-gamma-glutamyl-phosphate reductase [Nitrospirota bacterium]